MLLRCHCALQNSNKWDFEIKAEEIIYGVPKASNSPGRIQESACTIVDFLASVPQIP